MKKQYLIFLLFAFTFASCMEWDNYEGPQETLKGRIIDQNTKEPFQTEVGENGVRLRLMEYSWSDSPQPYYFDVMQDGTFQNTKVFKGDYEIEPLGAFVPFVLRDAEGNVTKDDRVTTTISGTTDLTFEVDPFLIVDWVGEPTLAADGKSISVDVRVSRGTSHPDFQQDVSEIYLFVNSSSSYVGDHNFDRRISHRIRGDAANDAVGKVVTLTARSLEGNRTYYLRVGAKLNVAVEGVQRYNYNEPISVDIP